MQPEDSPAPQLRVDETEDSGPTASPPADKEPSHHTEYYIHDDMAIFLVENTLFKVHRHFLVQESEVFRNMFACPPCPDGPEGIDDQRPITLPGVLCREFERLLDFFYHGMYRKPNAALKAVQFGLPDSLILYQWIDLLSISTRYDFRQVRQCAIQSIESHSALKPIEKIRLAEKYDIPHWRAPAFEALCQRGNSLDISEARVMGIENSTLLARAREMVRERHAPFSRRSKGSSWSPSPVEHHPYDPAMVRRVVREVFFPELGQDTSDKE